MGNPKNDDFIRYVNREYYKAMINIVGDVLVLIGSIWIVIYSILK